MESMSANKIFRLFNVILIASFFILIQYFFYFSLTDKTLFSVLAISISSVLFIIYFKYGYREIFFFTSIVIFINMLLIVLGKREFANFIAISIFVFIISTVIVYLISDKSKSYFVNNKKHRCICGSISLVFLIIFLIINIFNNFAFAEVKMIFLSKLFPDKYFVELSEIEVKKVKYQNNMKFNLDTNTPKNGETVSGVFVIEGWAIDASELENSNIDFILVYLNEKPQDGGKLIRGCDYGLKREDVGKVFGNQYISSGFCCEIDSGGLKNGNNKFYIFFHSTRFGWKFTELELIIEDY